MPVRTPGSTITVSTLNHRSLISRRAVRNRGTTEATAIPVMASAGSSPCSWKSWSMSSAISSAVRDATVAMRQWWSSSVPLPPGPSPGAYRPMTVWVLPTSMATSTAQRSRSRPMSSTGAEWVRAPTEIRSAPAEA